MRSGFLFISVILNLFIDFQIYTNHYSPVLIFLWFISILLIILSFNKTMKLSLGKIKISPKTILLLLIISLPVFTRVANYNLYRIHGDELITAYFSATENFAQVNFFSGIPSDKGQWVAQFPTVFFVLQKLSFLIFGESLLSVKLSVLPYVFIVSLMLYLLVKKIFNEKTAIISVILYSFFAVSLYFETLGLHFISSTAAFMVFFYLALRNLKENTLFLSVLTGISAGFCFLFYTTSYIASPLMVIFFLVQLLRIRKISVVKNFIITVVGFLIVLGPFFIYAYKFDNYFTTRINQVSLFTGSWSIEKKEIEKGADSFLIMKKSFSESIQSLYKDGIGGHGGYTFGQLAFFERFSLYLFLLGLGIGFIVMFKKIELLFIFLTIIFSFLTLVLSIPPPAYQRFSLAFPFIAIIFSLPFYLLSSFKKTNLTLRHITIFLLLSIYLFNNQQYFLKSTKKENNNIDLRLISYINQRYLDRNIYIAAYPGFALEKWYYFAKGKNDRKIQSDYHDNFLKRFNPQEKYVYVILFPEAFTEKFSQLDQKGEIINLFQPNYSLFAN